MNQLTANFHTHTARCHHAEGTDREYVEQAIKAGLKKLGFSDHCPMFYETKGYYPGYKMRPEQTQEYVNSILALKDEYKADIEIFVGFEVEYYPATFQKFLDFTENFPLDYMILGQHFLWREEDDDLSFRPGDSGERLSSYYQNVLEAAKTGLFASIAHPDALYFTGKKEVYERCTLDFLQEIKKLDIPLGLNRLGLADRRHYPNPYFWRLAGQVGNSAVIELDAHSPKVFEDTKSVERLYSFASQNHVKLLDCML